MENKKRRMVLFGIGGLIVLFLIIGVSYAVWQLNLTQTNENVVTTGCFKINFTEKNDINLNNAYPIIDAEGRKLTPYEFTIENTCDGLASYQVNLEILDSTTLMKHEYIKIMFDEGTPKILPEYIEVNKTLPNAITAYKLAKGKLNGKEAKTFTLRLWMDEDTPPVDDAMNKVFKSKITVTSSYKSSLDTTNMMKERWNGTDYDFMQESNKIVFQTTKNPIEGITSVDLSFNEDNSVLAYKDDKNAEEIITYIQANGKIKLPEDSRSFFYNYFNLTEIIGLENLDTSNVTNMSAMFERNNVTTLDLSTWDVSNVIDMSGMFMGVGVDDEGTMLSQLTNLNLSNWDTSSVENMRAMFFGSNNLTNLDLSHFDTSNVKDMTDMFLNCSKLTTLNLSGWNLKQNPEKEKMFEECLELIDLNVSNWYTSKVTDMSRLFSALPVGTLNLSTWDTSNVTNMSDMFSGCNNLMSLDISSFNTQNVTNMNAMFSGCNNLMSLDISSFNTQNVTNMSDMFSDCNSLTNLDVSTLNTQNVTNMTGMFFGCSGLTSLDVSTFNTSKVQYMGNVFEECNNLISINLNGWDTKNVKAMSAMFAGCTSLISLDISSFDTSNVQVFVSGTVDHDLVFGVVGMFDNCINLTNIVYGENFIYNEAIHILEDDITSLFLNCPANHPTHVSWNGVTFS